MNVRYEGVCLNPKDIPPDDLDDVILDKMIKEAGVFYRIELEGAGEIKLLIRANLKLSRRFLFLPDKCQHNTHHHTYRQ